MLFRKTHFIASCSDWKQWPASLETPVIGFWGRSNVGKSSLLNALLGGRLAHVSKTPGRTRLINLFENQEPNCILCDLPGYGYAHLSHREGKEIAQRLHKYLASPRAPHLLCWLVDSRHGLTKTDLEIAPLILELAQTRDLLIISTKNDKLTNNERINNTRLLEKQLDELDCFAPIVAFSCHSTTAIEELNGIFKDFLDAYSQKEPTE
jgi:GTP-binding protein